MADKKLLTPDLCVIGAGSAGLTVTSGAAQLGLNVVLIEAGEMGGDCLNVGCVPSKALLHAASLAHTRRAAPGAGASSSDVAVDFKRVMDHVRGAIAAIAPHDSQERFEGLGATVLRERAEFVDPKTVETPSTRVRARKFILATGSRPAVPGIQGLSDGPYLTSDTIWALDTLPRRLLVLGGGAIGVELAQAFRRLGAEVVIVEAAGLLGREDPDAVALLRARLKAEGVVVHERAKAMSVAHGKDEVSLTLDTDDAPASVSGSHLLVAVGRAPTVSGLGLEAAGVRYETRGVVTDARLRTSNKRVLAIGDVRGMPMFTHKAGDDGAVAIRNLLFKAPAKARDALVPRATYTDPEIASVGLTMQEARDRHGDKARILMVETKGNDRAIAEDDRDGFLSVAVDPKGDILGAVCVGTGAGDMIFPWCFAIANKLKIRAFTNVLAAYPTRSEMSKRAASAYYEPIVFNERTRALVRVLFNLPF